MGYRGHIGKLLVALGAVTLSLCAAHSALGQTTQSLANTTSTGTFNLSAGATWSPSTVPTNGDQVFIGLTTGGNGSAHNATFTNAPSNVFVADSLAVSNAIGGNKGGALTVTFSGAALFTSGVAQVNFYGGTTADASDTALTFSSNVTFGAMNFISASASGNNATLTLAGTSQGGSLTFNGGSGNSFLVISGPLGLTGTLAATNINSTSAGTISGNSTVGKVIINNTATNNFTITGSTMSITGAVASVAGGFTLANSATIALSGGGGLIISNVAPLLNGTLNIGNQTVNGKTNWANSGTVALAGGFIVGNNLTNNSAGTLLGYGNLSNVVVNLGTIWATNNTLAFASNIVQGGTLTIGSGSTISLLGSGALTNYGTINLVGASTSTNAILNLGTVALTNLANGTITGGGIIQNGSQVVNLSGGSILATSTVVELQFTNASTFGNAGTIGAATGATLTFGTAQTGTAIITNFGAINLTGGTLLSGNITNLTTGFLGGTGTIAAAVINQGRVNLGATISNTYLQTAGSFTVAAGGGTITGTATINGGTLDLTGNRLTDGQLLVTGTGVLSNSVIGATLNGGVSNAATVNFATDAYLNGVVTNTGFWLQRGAISNSVVNSGTMLVLSNTIAARITGGVVNSGSLTFTNVFVSGPVTNSGSFSFSGAISNNYVQTTGGSLSLDNNGTVTGSASITAGNFDLNGKTYSNGLMVVSGTGVLTGSVAGATFNGGLSNANVVAVTANTFFNGPVTNTGGFFFEGAISNNLVNSGSFNLNNNATLTVAPINTGTFNINGDTLTVNPAWSNSGTILIAGGTVAGGNLTNASGAVMNGAGNISSLLVNNGLLTVTNGTLTISVAPQQNGVVNVADGGSPGTLSVTPAWSNSGTVSIASGGAVNGGNFTNAASGTVTNLGAINTLLVNQGDVVLGGLVSNFQQASGTNTVSGAGTVTGTATLSGGLFDLNGGTYSNGLMVLSGSGVLTSSQAGATFNGGLSNAATVAITPGVFFNGLITNTGAIFFNGGALSNNLVSSGTVTLNNTATITKTAAINGGTLNLNGQTMTNGLLLVSGTGVVTNSVAGATINGGVSNNATIAVTANTFFNGIVTNTGAMFFQGAISNALVNNGSFNLNNNATLTVAPVDNGTINVAASTLTVNPAWLNGGSLQISGGVLAGGTVTNNGGDNISGFGTISNAVVNSGLVTASGGTLTLANAPTTQAGSGINVAGTGVLNVIPDWASSGTINIAAGGAISGGTLTNASATGTLSGSGFIDSFLVNQGRMDFGGTVSNNFLQTAGSFTVSGSATITGDATISGGAVDLVGNRLTAGQYVVTGSGLLTNSVTGATLVGGVTNAGTVWFFSDVYVNGPVTNTGTWFQKGVISNDVVNSGTFSLFKNSVNPLITGGIINSGSLTFDNNNAPQVNGSITNTGSIAFNAVVGGNYVQTAGSLVINQSAGNPTVKGTASISGGTFDLNGKTYTNGLMVVNGTGVLTDSVAGATFNGGLSNADIVAVTANTTFNGPVTNTGAFFFQGTVNNTLANGGNGTITLNNAATITQTTAINGGTLNLNGQTMSNGLLLVSGTGVVTNSIAGATVNGGVSNAGVIAVTANTFFKGPVTNTGGLFFQGAISNNLVNGANGTITLNNAATITQTAAINGGMLNLNGQTTSNGLLLVSGTGVVTNSIAGATVNGGVSNAGVIAVSQNTFFNGPVTNTGGLFFQGALSNNLVNGTTGTVTLNNTATITQTAAINGGTLNLNGQMMTNGLLLISGTGVVTNSVAGATVNGGVSNAGVIAVSQNTFFNGLITNTGAIFFNGGALSNNLVSSGTVTLNNTATITKTAAINGGTLNLNGQTMTNGLLLVSGTGVVTNSVAGATINGGVSNNATIAVTANTFFNGIVTNTGAMFFQGAISNALVNNGSFNLNNNATLTVAPVDNGTINVAASTLTVNPAWLNGGSLQISGGVLAGGTVTNNGGDNISGFGTISNAVVNSGLVTASGGTLTLANAPTTQAGSGINVAGTGVLNVIPDWASSGTINIAAGGAISGGTLTNASATGTLSGSGFIDSFLVNQGRMDFGGTVSNNFLQTAGSFTVSGSATITGDATISGGAVDLVGNRLTAGQYVVTGSGLLTNSVTGATLVGGVTNAGTVWFFSDVYVNGPVTNTGTWFQKGVISNDVVNSGTFSLFKNSVNPLITGGIINSGSLTFDNNNAPQVNGSITNTGSIAFNAVVGGNYVQTAGSLVINQSAGNPTVKGTASISGGTFDLNGKTYTNGLMVVNGTGVLTDSVAGATFNGGLSNADIVAVTANTTFNGPVTNTGAFFFQGTVNNTLANGGNGTITLNNAATITQTTAINGGTLNLNGQTMSNGLLLVSGTGVVTNSIAGATVNGGVSNAGVIAVTANTFFKGPVTNTGGLFFQGAISNNLVNGANGTITLNNAATITQTAAINGGMLNLNGQTTSNGLLLVSGTGVVTNSIAGATVNGGVSNAGVIAVSQNTFFNGPVTNTGGLFFQGALSNNLVNGTTGTVTLNNTATITQTAAINGGTLNLNGQMMTNGLLLISGTGVVTNSVAGATVNGGVSNAGVIAVSQNTFFNGLITNTGAIFFNGGALSNNLVSSGTVTLNNTATITKTAAINGGTLNLNGQTMTNGLLLVSGTGVVTNSVAGATINGGVSNNATIAVTANTFFNGIVTNTGAMFFQGAISNALVNNGSFNLNNNATLTVAPVDNGTINVAASTLTVNPAWLNGGSLQISGGVLAGGTVTNNGGDNISGFGTISNAVVNSGLVTASGGTLTLANAPTTQAGSGINVAGTGVLNVIPDWASSGTINIAAGGAISGGTLTNASATGTLSGSGFIDSFLVNQGRMDFGGTVSNNFLQTAGSFTVSGSATITGDATISGGAVDLVGNRLTAGQYVVTGSGLLTNSVTGATLVGGVTNAGTVWFFSDVYVNGPVTNTGTWFQKGVISNDVVNSGTFSLFKNSVNPLITGGIINSGSLTFDNNNAPQVNGSITNTGSIAFNAVVGGNYVQTAGSLVINQSAGNPTVKGTASISGGTFDLNGKTYTNGLMVVNGTGVLTDSVAGATFNGGLSNADIVAVTANTTFNGPVTNTGAFFFQGTVNNTLANGGNGTITLNNAATITQTTAINGGTLNLNGQTMSNGLLLVSGTGVVTNSIAGATVNGGVSNAGVIAVTANTFFKGPVTNTGGLFFQGAISNNLVNGANGTITLNNAATITQTAAINGGMLNLNGQTTSNGLLLVSGTGVVTNSIAGATVNGGVSNAGVIALTANTFFNGPVTNTGGLFFQGTMSNTFVNSANGTVTLNNTGTFTQTLTINSGTLNLNGGHLMNLTGLIVAGNGTVTNAIAGASVFDGFVNNATVAFTADTFLNGVVTNNGAFFFQGAISNALVNSGSFNLNNNATITAAPVNSGTFNLVNGTLNVTPAWANAGTIFLSGGGLSGGNVTNNNTVVGAGAVSSLLVNAGSLFATNGILTAAAGITNNATGQIFLRNTGTLNGGTIINVGTIATLSGGNVGAAIINTVGGDIQGTNGTLLLNGKLTNLGSISVSGGATWNAVGGITNAAGADILLQNTGTLNGSTITNLGLIAAVAGGNIGAQVVNVASGMVLATNQTLNLSGGLVNQSLLQIGDGTANSVTATVGSATGGLFDNSGGEVRFVSSGPGLASAAVLIVSDGFVNASSSVMSNYNNSAAILNFTANNPVTNTGTMSFTMDIVSGSAINTNLVVIVGGGSNTFYNSGTIIISQNNHTPGGGNAFPPASAVFSNQLVNAGTMVITNTGNNKSRDLFFYETGGTVTNTATGSILMIVNGQPATINAVIQQGDFVNAGTFTFMDTPSTTTNLTVTLSQAGATFSNAVGGKVILGPGNQGTATINADNYVNAGTNLLQGGALLINSRSGGVGYEVNSGTILFSGGGLNVDFLTNTASGVYDMTVAGQTINNPFTIASFGTITTGGGTLQNSGTIDLRGGFLNGLLNNSAGALLSITNGTTTVLSGGILNGGAINLQSAGTLTGGAVTNQSGGVIAAVAGGNLGASVVNLVGGVIQATNQTLNMLSNLLNNGTIIVNAGKLNVTPAWVNAGTITMSNGGTLTGGNLTNNLFITGSGTISNLLVNAGAVIVTNGTLLVTTAPINTGSITVADGGAPGTLNVVPAWANAGFVSIVGGGNTAGGNLTNLASGTVTNLGVINTFVVNQGRTVLGGTINNSFLQTGGTNTVSGKGTITGTATVTGGLFNLNGGTYSNGLMVLGGTGLLTNGIAGGTFNGGLSNAATVAATANTFFNGVVTNTGTFAFLGAVSNMLVNSGDVILNGSGTISGVLANSGSVNVNNGTLSLVVAPTQTGSITVSAGATLNAAQAWVNNGTITMLGGVITNAAITNANFISGYGTIDGGGVVNNGQIFANASSISGIGTQTVRLASFTNNAAATIGTASTNGVLNILQAGNILINQGTVSLSGGTIIFNGGAGTITNFNIIAGVGNVANFPIINAGTLASFVAQAPVSGLSNLIATIGVTNNGLLGANNQINGAATLSLTVSGGGSAIVNQGTVALQGGFLTVNGGAGVITNVNNGLVYGIGTQKLSVANLTTGKIMASNGIFSLGLQSNANAGVLSNLNAVSTILLTNKFLVNTGTIVLDGGGLLLSGSVITNENSVTGPGAISSSLYNDTPGVVLATNGVLNIATNAGESVQNLGLFTITGDGTLNVVPAWLNTNGTVNILGGVLAGGAATNAGIISGFGTISSLLVNQDLVTVSNGTLTVSTAPMLASGGVSITPSGVLNVIPSWASSGTIALAAGGAITGGTLTNASNNGTLSGSGYVKTLLVNQGRMDFGGTVSNNFIQTSGSFTLSGNATITGAATIGGGVVDLVGRHLTDSTLAVTGSGVLTNGIAGGTVDGGVSNAATVAVTADTFFNGIITNTGSIFFQGAISNNVVNSGAFTLNNNATIATGALINKGQVFVTNGTLDLVNAPTQNGTVNVANAATLDVVPAWRNGGGLNVLGGTVIGSTLTNAGIISGSGTISPSVLNISGATITASSGGTLTLTAIPFQNGIVNILGTLNVASAWSNGSAGTVTMNGGVLTGGALQNLGTLHGFGTLNPNVSNNGQIIADNASQALVFNNALANAAGGVVSANNGRMFINGVFTNSGTLSMINSIGTFASAVVNSGAWVTDPTTNIFQNTYTVTSSGFIQSSAGDVYVFSNNATTAASFINVSTNKTQYNTLNGTFQFANTLGLTQVFATAGHDFGPPATTATNQIELINPNPFSLPEYSNNFALGTLEISSFTTVRVDDAFITGGAGTDDNLEAALYLNNLDMGTDSLLMISSNVQVYFISSNNWTLANVQLQGNPTYDQTFDGIHQLVVVPEPAIVLLWLSSIATVYAARKRGASKK